jgi:hypothetical protein
MRFHGLLSTAIRPGVYSASNRNEYQKEKIMFLGSKVLSLYEADNLTAICADCLYNVESLTSHNPRGLHGLLRG